MEMTTLCVPVISILIGEGGSGGALALAAYSSEAGAAAGEMDRLFVKMFGISAIGVVTLSTLAYFGFYRWLL